MNGEPVLCERCAAAVPTSRRRKVARVVTLIGCVIFLLGGITLIVIGLLPHFHHGGGQGPRGGVDIGNWPNHVKRRWT